MATVRASSERTVPARTERVWELVRDYERRPRILSDAFVDYRVESGGQGAGTVVRYKLNAGRRERAYRMEVDEPAAGRELRERDSESTLATRWSLTPAGDGESTRVELSSEWRGAGGIGGFFERRFAPAALSRIYADVLARLESELRASADAA